MPLADCNWTPTSRALGVIVPVSGLAIFLLVLAASYRSTEPSRRMALLFVFALASTGSCLG